jgi:hypothetical protein
MPALPPVPGCVKLNLHWQVGPDGNAQSVLHFSYTGSQPTQSAIAAWQVQINAAAAADFAPVMFTANQFIGSQVTDLASNTGNQGFTAAVVPGTRGGQTLAAQVATLVNKHINTRYRGGKPRTYLPWGQGGDLSNDETWTPAYVTAAANAYTTFIGAISNKTQAGTVFGQEVAVSYYSGFTVVTDPVTGRARNVPKLRTGGPVVYVITSSTVNPKPATLRARLQR